MSEKGATLKEIEENIHIEHGLVLSADLSDQIKVTLHKMVDFGSLEKHGRIYKVPSLRWKSEMNSEMKSKIQV